MSDITEEIQDDDIDICPVCGDGLFPLKNPEEYLCLNCMKWFEKGEVNEDE